MKKNQNRYPKFKIEEGNKYYFGDINFIGNAVYSNDVLQQILGLKKGDVYNGVVLKKGLLIRVNQMEMILQLISK